MEQKSGIQMIEELLGGMVVMDRRLQVLEQLLKQLLTVANTESCPKPVEKSKIKVVKSRINSVDKTTKPEFENIKTATNARIAGKIIQNEKGVPEVNITIFDDKNNAIKKTRTNRSGEWIAYLPPGRYVAECVLEGKINGNVNFNVGQGDKIVYVGQPT